MGFNNDNLSHKTHKNQALFQTKNRMSRDRDPDPAQRSCRKSGGQMVELGALLPPYTVGALLMSCFPERGTNNLIGGHTNICF